MLTFETQKVLRWIVAVVLIPLVAWAFRTYDASKLDTTRFVVDSTSRVGKEEMRDSLLRAMNDRLRDIYCEGRGPGCR
ncbi:MAG: hypothetical protein ACYC1Z_13590 [Georgenia sp.]